MLAMMNSNDSAAKRARMSSEMPRGEKEVDGNVKIAEDEGVIAGSGRNSQRQEMSDKLEPLMQFDSFVSIRHRLLFFCRQKEHVGEGNWAMLPSDLMQLCFGHLLSVQDRVRVSSVCSRWRQLLYSWDKVKQVHIDGRLSVFAVSEL